MHHVSLGDNSNEMPNPFQLKNQKLKYHNFTKLPSGEFAQRALKVNMSSPY